MSSQKITPFLWFDEESEDAIQFYINTFPGGNIKSLKRYADGPLKGKILIGIFEILGHQFMAFDGGPKMAQKTPAVSFFVNCETEQEVRQLFGKLSQDKSAAILMPLDKYPFSDLFGWVMDKFGVTWQVILDPKAKATQCIVPCLMYTGDQYGRATEAINKYVAAFPDSKVDEIVSSTSETVMHATFTLAGQKFKALDSGHDHGFIFTEAMSLHVNCETQDEVDSLWDKLCDGGSEQPCAWLKDTFGLSWQIVPEALPRLLSDPDRTKVKRVTDVMMKMTKIVIKDLEKAYLETSTE